MIEANENLMDLIYFRKVFSPEECHKIIKFADFFNSNSSEENPRMYISQQNKPETFWVRQRLLELVKMANRSYKFNLSDNPDDIQLQLIEYKENGILDWHVDIDLTRPGWDRKLITVSFLSRPEDYEGGQLKFYADAAQNQSNINQDQGNVVIYPTYIPHMVEKVIKGKRYVLSSLFYGRNFV